MDNSQRVLSIIDNEKEVITIKATTDHDERLTMQNMYTTQLAPQLILKTGSLIHFNSFPRGQPCDLVQLVLDEFKGFCG